MKETLLRFNKKQKYMFFDYETCNLNLVSEDNKPWQLAFIVTDLNKTIDKADYLIKWKNLNVSKEAAKITGFNKVKYEKNNVCAKKVLDHFEKYLYDPSIIKVGHNIFGFDFYMHNIHRKACGKKTDYSYVKNSLDTVCLARAIKKGIKKQKETDLVSWQYRLLNIRERNLKVNLQQCCKDYDIEFEAEKLHDALYDIERNVDFFKKMIWDIEV
jgi:DNA polymerase III epsilon subunit-like protein